MKLAMGSDHAGFGLRSALAKWAKEQGHSVAEYGAMSREPYDYPDAADAVARVILAHEAEMGVLVCGSGIGVSIRANRHLGIRAAECCSARVAVVAREHNHANVLCLGERFMDENEGIGILTVFLSTPEDPDERHIRRVGKLDAALEEDLERTK